MVKNPPSNAGDVGLIPAHGGNWDSTCCGATEPARSN